MNKIYGYKEKDIIGLINTIRENNDLNLSEIFSLYGKKNRKSQGTIRNLYYALAKRSQEDEEFCNKYLNGKPVYVSKIEGFTDEEERELLTKIFVYKSQGYSVRYGITKLSQGDSKLALRYQNKYRNIMKNNPELVKEVTESLSEKGISIKLNEKRTTQSVSKTNMEKLKAEIDGLCERISEQERRENKRLKEQIMSLEKENLKLMKLLYGQSDYMMVEKYFKGNGNKKIQI